MKGLLDVFITAFIIVVFEILKPSDTHWDMSFSKKVEKTSFKNSFIGTYSRDLACAFFLRGGG